MERPQSKPWLISRRRSQFRTLSGAEITVDGDVVVKLHRPGTDPAALATRLRAAARLDCLLSPLSAQPERVGTPSTTRRYRKRMPAQDQPVTVLSEEESWNLLASVSLGRLVTSMDGQPEIFPVNFVTQRPTVLFRTAEGTKLFHVVMNERVAFEADDHGIEEGWSVMVKGRAHGAVHTRRYREGRTRPAVVVDGDGEAALCPRDRR